MKVSEIDGPLLDYWVAKAEWGDAQIVDGDVLGGAGSEWDGQVFSPTKIWAQGGPLIEKKRIRILPPEGGRLVWLAEVGQAQGLDALPLIAAMRAFVAAKFGDEVPAE
ncbi:phage protein NinX family protein [Cupriavidus necator]